MLRTSLTLLLLTLGFQSLDARAPATVQFLGTMHHYHLDNRFGVSLGDLEKQLTAMNPDLICGEIVSEEYETEMQGVNPPEQVLIEEVAATTGALYLASDWRGSYRQSSQAWQAMTETERKRIHRATQTYLSYLPKNPEEMFTFFHSEDAAEHLRQLNQTIIASATEVGHYFWSGRNQQIVKRCLRYAKKHRFQHIVFVFGVGHAPIIQNLLYAEPSVVFKPTQQHFEHQNNAVSETIVARWQQQRRALERLMENPETALETKEFIRKTKRIELLDTFIQTKGESR